MTQSPTRPPFLSILGNAPHHHQTRVGTVDSSDSIKYSPHPPPSERASAATGNKSRGEARSEAAAATASVEPGQEQQSRQWTWSSTPLATGSPRWASGASTTGGGAGSGRPAATTSSTAAIATTTPRSLPCSALPLFSLLSPLVWLGWWSSQFFRSLDNLCLFICIFFFLLGLGLERRARARPPRSRIGHMSRL